MLNAKFDNIVIKINEKSFQHLLYKRLIVKYQNFLLIYNANIIHQMS